MVYVTRGLLETLLRLASEREPNDVTISLSVTPAGDIPDLDRDLDDDVSVFTHFYLPAAGEAVSAVFGMDIGTPVGQTQGRFVSHPKGGLDVSVRDDLHAVVFVAVPPWDRESVAAFDRSGRRQTLDVLDVEPPQESASL
ncbi:MAG: hypothetical protein ABEI96_07725 [Haloarculaceae archaeon]